MALAIDAVPALKDNYVYLVHSQGQTAVIDPSETAPILAALEQRRLSLDLILCTHHHWDHVGGAIELARRFNCPIWASRWDARRVEGCTRGLDDGETFVFGGSEFRVLHVPGHTAGQIAFYLPAEKALFVGDTLFSLGCGRLFEGTPAEMFASLKRIGALPDETRIFFGHEYTLRNAGFALQIDPGNAELKEYLNHVQTTLDSGRPSTPAVLGLEKRINPFLNTDSLEEWTKRRELRNVF